MNQEITEEDTNAALVQLDSIVPKEILERLREEFPRDTHESKKMDNNFVQTGIKPAYVTERLNQVFGFEGWEAEEVEIREEGKDIATKVKLTIFIITKSEDGTYTKIPIASRTQWGSSRRYGNQLYGDVLKSAFTNGLCKAASLFDVAHDAYKGLLAPVESLDDMIDEDEADAHDKKKSKTTKTKKLVTKSEPETTSSKNANTADLKVLRKRLLGLFTSKGLTRKSLQDIMVAKFNKDESRQLSELELEQLVKLVEDMPNESHSKTSESATEEVAA